MTQVLDPLVKAVQLSALRQTISPLRRLLEGVAVFSPVLLLQGYADHRGHLIGQGSEAQAELGTREGEGCGWEDREGQERQGAAQGKTSHRSTSVGAIARTGWGKDGARGKLPRERITSRR